MFPVSPIDEAGPKTSNAPILTLVLYSTISPSGPNRHYMRHAVADLDAAELERLWSSMMRRKHVHRYSDIARIWILVDCRKEGAKAAIRRAESLGISSETRRHWFGPDLKQWLARMKRMERMDGAGGAAVLAPSQPKLSVEDMEWIESLFLAEPLKGRVYRDFAVRLRAHAASTSGKGHLQNVSVTTVWRVCRRLKNCVVTDAGTKIPERVKQPRKRPVLASSASHARTKDDRATEEIPLIPIVDSSVPF